MKYKKVLIFICLIVSVFTIASVYASDVNETVLASENQIEIGDGGCDVFVNEQNLNNISTTKENKLQVSTGTFTDLANEIINTNTELKLVKNYSFNDCDKNFTKGIPISKNITINGNGYTIDGKNQSRGFNIINSKITIKNINFINCQPERYDYGGAAIKCENSIINIINSTFISNHVREKGGAVYLRSVKNISIINSTFINNNGGSSGGAVYLTNVENISILNSTFINNSAFNGGAIFFTFACNNTIFDCNFINNGKLSGACGAVYFERICDYNNIINSKFVNNFASESALKFLFDSGPEANNIVNSTFINNTGGALSIGGCDNNIIDSIFINNTGNTGGALSIGGCDNNIIDSIFINNTGDDGGAIYVFHHDNKIINSTFINNTANKGGAISLDGDNHKIINSIFSNNKADKGASVYYRECKYNEIIHSTFINHNFKSSEEDGIVSFDSSSNNNKIINSNFKNNLMANGFILLYKNYIYPIINCSFFNNTVIFGQFQYDVSSNEELNEIYEGVEEIENCIIKNNYGAVISGWFPDKNLYIDSNLNGIFITDYSQIGQIYLMNGSCRVKTNEGDDVLSGRVILTINNTTYVSRISNGKAEFNNIKIIKEFKTYYDCTISYQGSSQLIHKTKNFKMFIKTRPSFDSIKEFRYTMGEYANITANIYSDYEYYKNGNISININGKNYEMFKSKYNPINDIFGTYEVYLPINNYIPELSKELISQTSTTETYMIYCSSDDFHGGNSVRVLVKWITPIYIDVNVSSNKVLVGEEVSFEVFAYDCYNPISRLIYKEYNYEKEMHNPPLDGRFNFTRKFDEIGEHIGLIKTNWGYNSTKKVSIEVYSPTEISPINNIISKRNSDIKLNLDVVGSLGKKYDGMIFVELDGKNYTFNSISNVIISTPKKVGTYTCKVTFHSKNKYVLDSSRTFKITSKYGIKIAVKSVTGYQGNNVKLTANVKDDAGNKIKTGKVTFKINGKTYNANVKNGIARITIKYPKAKWYKDVTKTKGNNKYVTSYYKSTYVSSATFKSNEKYVTNSTTFKVISKSKTKHLYGIYKHRTFIYPVTNSLKFYDEGPAVIGVGMKYVNSYKKKLIVGVGDDNDRPIKFKVKTHFKKNGKWRWDNWFYCDNQHYFICNYGIGVKIDKVQINCYFPHIIKFY